MNYLDLVNNVLRRMREDQVSSIYENQQSTVIADFINDARRHVEEAHDWTTLYTDFEFNTAASDKLYSLTGTQNRATIYDARNLTSMAFLKYVPSAQIRRSEMISNPGESAPTWYTVNGVDSNGDTQIELWPVPDGIYQMSVHMVQREDDLTEDGSITTLPHMPIIHMAHMLAVSERGDVSSQDMQMLSSLAAKSLNDAIQYDMARQPENNVWAPV